MAQLATPVHRNVIRPGYRLPPPETFDRRSVSMK
jgi:hypothetical protein